MSVALGLTHYPPQLFNTRLIMSETTAPDVAGDEPIKKKTKTLEGPVPVVPEVADDENRNAVENRFRPSGITHPDYEDTRVRRFEPYQVHAIRLSLDKQKIRKVTDLDAVADNPAKLAVVARHLGACLVRPFRKSGSAQLFRRGEPGLARLKKDVSPAEIVAAAKVAYELSGVFEE